MKQQGPTTQRRARALLITSTLVVLVGLVGVVATRLLFQPFYIPSEAMEPTLTRGTSVWTRPTDGSDVKPYDIVVHERSTTATPGPSSLLVKRVIAVGGDTVSYASGHVLVNGQQTREDFLAPGTSSLPGPDERGRSDAISIPQGSVYAMGDNRTNSQDSRYLGPIPVADLRYRVVLANAPRPLTPIVGLGSMVCIVLGAIGIVVALIRRTPERNIPDTTAVTG